MGRFEDLMNSLTDIDWGWWPVLFLRPPKNVEIDTRVLLKMTCAFGPMTGALALLIYALWTHEVTVLAVALHIILGCVAFFGLYKTSFALFWNRRARRLQRSESEAT